jgi:hypothetical protein
MCPLRQTEPWHNDGHARESLTHSMQVLGLRLGVERELTVSKEHLRT